MTDLRPLIARVAAIEAHCNRMLSLGQKYNSGQIGRAELRATIMSEPMLSSGHAVPAPTTDDCGNIVAPWPPDALRPLNDQTARNYTAAQKRTAVEWGNQAADQLGVDRLAYWQGRASVAEAHEKRLRADLATATAARDSALARAANAEVELARLKAALAAPDPVCPELQETAANKLLFAVVNERNHDTVNRIRRDAWAEALTKAARGGA